MAWKIEKWFDEVFPGERDIYDAYRHLPRRELAIVAAGSLDVALAELIAKRFVNQSRECEEFLGANEDGRAPAGSFGARIQLAVLLGVITPEDAEQLRIIKSIRNKFAHRTKIDFSSDSVISLVVRLYETTRARTKKLVDSGLLEHSGPMPEFDVRSETQSNPEAGAAVLLIVFGIFQAYFSRITVSIPRIELYRKADGST
jgi:DNA-binding MltR family transcriptional regulator